MEENQVARQLRAAGRKHAKTHLLTGELDVLGMTEDAAKEIERQEHAKEMAYLENMRLRKELAATKTYLEDQAFVRLPSNKWERAAFLGKLLQDTLHELEVDELDRKCRDSSRW